MNTPNSQAWTLRFSLFGIPVRIRPIAWVVLAILGGAFGVDDGGDLGRVLVFVAVALTMITGCEGNKKNLYLPEANNDKIFSVYRR